MEEIKVGDVVYIKSGSPRMTVSRVVNDTTVEVVYFPYGGNNPVTGCFLPAAALVKQESGRSPADAFKSSGSGEVAESQ